MTLYILHMLTDQYGADAQITDLVNTRETYIIFTVNPDGSEYDIATGTYQILAQEPPAHLGLLRHRFEPQLRLQLGLLRRIERLLPSATPTGARTLFQHPKPNEFVISSSPAWSVVCSRSKHPLHSTRTVSWSYGRMGIPIPTCPVT
jgi:hypothetical protein